MLYFFHHYELPVILQQAQLQQLLLRTHRGMAGVMGGLAGIAALASGGAYHDAPGTGTQATPPTAQSTTQTVQNTAQSTTQTSPSVSTAQTNTLHSGDMLSPEIFDQAVQRALNSRRRNSNSRGDSQESSVAPRPTNDVRTTDKDNPATTGGDADIKIEEIARKKDSNNKINIANGNSVTNETEDAILPSGTNSEATNVTDVNDETSTLDRRRKYSVVLNNDDPPLVRNEDPAPLATDRLAPRASPEADELD